MLVADLHYIVAILILSQQAHRLEDLIHHDLLGFRIITVLQHPLHQMHSDCKWLKVQNNMYLAGH